MSTPRAEFVNWASLRLRGILWNSAIRIIQRDLPQVAQDAATAQAVGTLIGWLIKRQPGQNTRQQLVAWYREASVQAREQAILEAWRKANPLWFQKPGYDPKAQSKE